MGDPRFSDTATREADAQVTQPDLGASFRVLLLVSAFGKAQVFDFDARRSLSVGRAEPADIQLDDPSLSRLHARFSCEGDLVRVTDLGSRNGTWVQGARVRESLLRAGDVAVLGGATITIQVTPSAQAALLGLSSSAALLARLDEEWARAHTFRRSLAVLALRPARPGEVSVAAIAAECAAKLRPIDRIGLYDRNAVLIVLPETGLDAAARVAQELTAKVRGRGQLVCGVAAYPQVAGAPQELVTAAFEAAARATSERHDVQLAPRTEQVRDCQDEAMVLEGEAMRQLARVLDRIAPRPIAVLLTGETGTGKEVIARELHRRSTRSAAPLKVVNCAAIPEALIESALFGHVKGAFTGAEREHPGVFAQASSGTVFLDEVGELSESAQAALLRVLDTHRVCPVGGTSEIEVDVRVVAATHRDLARMCDDGTFRLDLYHRLNGVVLHLPPLRERRDEIAVLAEHFLRRVERSWGGVRVRLSEEALACFHAYHWPGNVRELRNVIERAVALCEGDVIGLGELPMHLQQTAEVNDLRESVRARSGGSTLSPAADFPASGVDLRARVHDHEAMLIREALRMSDGNQRRAAELLRLPLRTLERKLRALAVTGPRGD